jgi:phage terminase large subunit-like protein
MTILRTNGCLESYAQAVLSSEIPAGQELKAVLRQLMEDMDGDEWIYDTTDADRRMGFMEGCVRLTKSPWFGKPMVLMQWQRAFISAVYGFRTPDGNPRFQRVLLLISRKGGKSQLASALLLTDMVIGGHGRDIVCSSNDDPQADILFQACDTMREMIDPRSVDTWRNQKGLKCRLNDNRIFKLSDRSRNKEGRNIDVAVVDEVHEMRDNVIVKSIEQSQSTKEDPLLIMITTEGVVNDGFLDQELRRARSIIAGEAYDLASRRYLPWLYTQDSEREVWEGNRENRLWMKSNPTLGEVKRWDYLEQQVDLARQSKADRAYVLCKDFNIKQNTSEAWLMPEDYSYDAPFDPESFRGAVCIGGVDLAETTDLSCAKAILMKPDDPRKYVLTMYFIPEGKLERSDDRSAGARYEQWAREGILRICPGNYLDVTVLADWFLELYKTWGLKPYKVGYDAKFATEFLQRMESYGFDCEIVYQSPEVMNLPVKMVESDLKSHHVAGLNALDRWCLSNACLKINSQGNGLLVKADGLASRKIDGAVTLAIAYEMWRRNRTEFAALTAALSQKGQDSP